MKWHLALLLLLSGCSRDPASHEIELIGSLPSPDGQHVAATYSDMGGGAAGWCYVCIDVMPGAFDPTAARCRQKQQWFRCSAEVALLWQSNTTVVASYSGDPATTPVPLSQAASTTPNITIVYKSSEVPE